MKAYFNRVLTAICALCFSICAVAQSNIPIIQDPQNIGGDGGKPIIDVPVVTLDGTILTICFPTATSSQVIIKDQLSNQTVYSDDFAFSTMLQIDLSEEGLTDGNYILRIYAFGKWWWGEFVIEDN